MPKFYLHLFNRIGSTSDEEGVELPDLATARKSAAENIRSIMSEEVKEGLFDLNGRIEIVDDQGRLLATVPFADAVELKLTGGGR
jgi:hypothetical protein